MYVGNIAMEKKDDKGNSYFCFWKGESAAKHARGGGVNVYGKGVFDR